jgi:hypothetical protein
MSAGRNCKSPTSTFALEFGSREVLRAVDDRRVARSRKKAQESLSADNWPHRPMPPTQFRGCARRGRPDKARVVSFPLVNGSRYRDLALFVIIFKAASAIRRPNSL